MDDVYVVYRVAFDGLARTIIERLAARDALGPAYGRLLAGCRGIDDVFELASYPTPERERVARVITRAMEERRLGLRDYAAYRALVRARRRNGDSDGGEPSVLARVVSAEAFAAAAPDAAAVYSAYEEALGRARPRPLPFSLLRGGALAPAVAAALMAAAALSVLHGPRLVDWGRVWLASR
ncbi:hypothetical protein GMRT_12059 [Giardia muris]|uniref:Uncharacterized protein n=1 Tax=Giardia muris TaxID=5742 RepID=A0A4Z1T5A8_GIAMU|nr:hypothetical protein GMRT_12059 [Giardia muris]|eukprot:TNJ27699.1 hypothetical protein GMRT_12059 [Giardia muris]